MIKTIIILTGKSKDHIINYMNGHKGSTSLNTKYFLN